MYANERTTLACANPLEAVDPEAVALAIDELLGAVATVAARDYKRQIDETRSLCSELL